MTYFIIFQTAMQINIRFLYLLHNFIIGSSFKSMKYYSETARKLHHLFCLPPQPSILLLLMAPIILSENPLLSFSILRINSLVCSRFVCPSAGHTDFTTGKLFFTAAFLTSLSGAKTSGLIIVSLSDISVKGEKSEARQFDTCL